MKTKPAKLAMIAILQNLQSTMETSAEMLKRYELIEHSSELKGASKIVRTWIEGLNEKV